MTTNGNSNGVEAKTNGSAKVQHVDALVVGAGFGGLYCLHRLRKLGLSTKLFEAGGELGGIWYWNCYPGARVDSDAPSYQFFMEETWKDWTWTERYPDWKELRRYFKHVDQKLDLSKDISMATRVMSAEWVPAEERWTIKTDTGVVVSAKYFVTSTGYTAKKYIPDFKGLDKFKGEWHHTAAWPQEGIDMMGKRVGIIGTGASGVQIIQEIGPQVKNLTVFQRTPNQAIAMQQEKLYAYEQNAEKNYYAGIMGGLKDSFGGFRFSRDPRSALEVTKEERLTHYEKLWAKGGFTYWLGNFNDILTNQEANDTTYEFWRDKVRARLRDPRVREKLAPMKAAYCFGTKRPCLEQTFYEVFNQPNVELIDINEEPIVEITEKGVKTAGKEYEMDILVMATGFDSVTGGLTQIDIKGLDGCTVKDKWAGGVASYLGMTCAGFPNLFWLYGPHGPTAFCNGPTCAQLQGGWIVETIEWMERNKKATINPTEEAEHGWTTYVHDLASKTLFPKTKSWYMGSNIPGKKVESLNYTGGVPKYAQEIKDVAATAYKGFLIS